MVPRRAHWLRCNKQSRMPRKLIFLGADWNECPRGDGNAGVRIRPSKFAMSVWRRGDNGFLRQYIIDGLRPVDVCSLLETECDSRYALWVFAERMVALYSGIYYCGEDNTDKPVVTVWILSDSASALYCTLRGCKVTFVESGNYLPGGRGWRLGAVNDLEKAETAVIPVIQSALLCDFGNWSVTLGGIAWNCYRHKFMQRVRLREDSDGNGYSYVKAVRYNRKILVHAVPDVLQLERRCYYGGEVYVAFEGRILERVTHLDVNGLYGHCMQQEGIPWRLREWSRFSTPDTLLDEFQEGTVAADVMIDSLEDTYPVRYKGRTIHATGRFRTSLCGKELLRALKAGHVIDSWTYATYDVDDLFGEYVEWMWKLRLDAERAGCEELAKLAKLLVNSLYGKFASQRKGWYTIKGVESKQPWGRYWQTDPNTCQPLWCRSVENNVKVWREQSESPDSIPIVSAVIASSGREYMRMLRRCAGKGNVYYGDTDSLLVNDTGHNVLRRSGRLDGNRLGAIGTVGATTNCEIVGVKHYVWDGRRIASGLQSDAVQIDAKHYHQVQYESASKLLDLEPDGTLGVTTARYTVRRPRRTYTVGPDGWTRPINLQEE